MQFLESNSSLLLYLYLYFHFAPLFFHSKDENIDFIKVMLEVKRHDGIVSSNFSSHRGVSYLFFDDVFLQNVEPFLRSLYRTDTNGKQRIVDTAK